MGGAGAPRRPPRGGGRGWGADWGGGGGGGGGRGVEGGDAQVAQSALAGARSQVFEPEAVAQHRLAEGEGDGGFFPGAQVAFDERDTEDNGRSGVDVDVVAECVIGLAGSIVADAVGGTLQVP